LFPRVKHGIHPQEKIELARCIVYHDLAEVLLGDIPAYTNVDDSKRNRDQVVAEQRLRKLPAGEPKRVAMEFISMFLNDRERESLRTAERVLSDHENRVGRFFVVLDKIDPIIAVWRYIHQFRGALDTDAREFLKTMKDFFANPNVKAIATAYREDSVIERLVLTLQDRQRARAYYRDATSVPDDLFGDDKEAFSYLIQGTTLMAVPKRGARTTKTSRA
jgi:5'-deoxynucleotidase YfbR-like HD superfamily hydrolase